MNEIINKIAKEIILAILTNKDDYMNAVEHVMQSSMYALRDCGANEEDARKIVYSGFELVKAMSL